VPVALINARMSDRSFRRYQKIPALARRLFGHLSLILCATPSDLERFVAVGADPARTRLTGSLKVDVPAPALLTSGPRAALREELGFFPAETSPSPASGSTLQGFNASTPLILLGSSTWPGEEEMLLATQQEARAAGLDVRLLLVPRHAERRREIITLLEKQPLPWHARSTTPRPPQPVMIYLGDTTGELLRLSQAADVAFIGKSLPPNYGGQTPIEAAALGVPLVFGPYMSNFKDIARALEEGGAAVRVADAPAARAALLALLQDAPRRAKMSAAGRAWHAASQGATARTAAALAELLSDGNGS
jgi:3-deoxy-D-manno-octulosonic-acid transferase